MNNRLPPNLLDLVNGNIYAIIPALNEDDDQNAILMYKLHAVESSGLWLENQSLTDVLLKSAREKISAKTDVFFVPFSQVKIVLGEVGVPSLSSAILEDE